MKKVCIYMLFVSYILAGCSVNEHEGSARQEYSDVKEDSQEQPIIGTYDSQGEMQDVQGKEERVLKEEKNIKLENEKICIESLEEQNSEKRRNNSGIQVSIKRISKPITNDDGKVLATVYYERPIVSENTEAAKKINLFFEQEEQDWLEGRAGRLTLYSENYFSYFKERVKEMCEWYDEESILRNPLRYAVDTWIVLLNDNLLSIMQIANVNAAHCNWHYFGATFDLKTGELIPINSLINISPTEMKKIIEDTSEPVRETYDELKDDNYSIHYYETEIAMNYEYFYNGKSYFIILNRGDERFVDGEIIEWNGKWGDEYEINIFRYSIDSEDEKLIVTVLT